MTSAWSSIKARRRWTVWMEFFGSEFAVAVFIEILQGLPRILHFTGGNPAVLVRIQGGDQRWRRRRSHGTTSSGWLAFVVSGRTHFFRADQAIAIAVQFAQHCGCILDFLRGKLAIAVGVEQSEARWWWRGRPVLSCRRPVLCLRNRGEREPCEYQMSVSCFHRLSLDSASEVPETMAMKPPLCEPRVWMFPQKC